MLNAGHEATVHTIGNGVKALLETGLGADVLAPDRIEATVEEILRYDPPLHMFTRWAYEDIEVGRHMIPKGGRVACLLGAANRDPARWYDGDQFDPGTAGPDQCQLRRGRAFLHRRAAGAAGIADCPAGSVRRCPDLRLAEDAIATPTSIISTG